jgi:hypothetical protein
MFNNIGGTIKTVAKVLFFVGIGVSFLGWIILLSVGIMDSEIAMMVESLVALILGLFTSWFSTLLLYGFGQLIENTDILARWDEEDNNT